MRQADLSRPEVRRNLRGMLFGAIAVGLTACGIKGDPEPMRDMSPPERVVTLPEEEE